MTAAPFGTALAGQFQPPYTAVVFSSLRTPGDQGYGAVAQRMEELASEQPGYLGIESARDPETGLGITVSYWRDDESARAWKQVSEHEKAQANGRRLWYTDYVVRVATVEREYGFAGGQHTGHQPGQRVAVAGGTDGSAGQPEVDEQGRPEPPRQADEFGTLTGFLDFLRATAAWKTSGLSDEAMARALPPSSMTAIGVLKHLALVEDHWFSVMLHDNPPAQPWAGVDWSADEDWEWNSAAADGQDAVRRLWQESVSRSRDLAGRFRAEHGMAGTCRRTRSGQPAHSLRWVLTHMVEEYARHCGHLDLIRESLDGQTGE